MRQVTARARIWCQAAAGECRRRLAWTLWPGRFGMLRLGRFGMLM